MILITEKEEYVLKQHLAGQSASEIAANFGKTPEHVRYILRVLSTKGLLHRLGACKYRRTNAAYELIESHKPARMPKQTLTSVDPEVLEYIRGHYPLYRNRRGVLARRLGMSRTLLNQIVIEHLGGETA